MISNGNEHGMVQEDGGAERINIFTNVHVKYMLHMSDSKEQYTNFFGYLLPVV